MVAITPLWLIHGFALLALIVASITDLRKREVPDLLNFSLIAIGLMIGLLNSIFGQNIWFLVSSVLGLILGYLIGAAMFYTGQWGGGDAKMLMGLGALLGFDAYTIIEKGFSAILESTFINVFVSIFIAGIIYGIGYLVFVTIKHWKTFRKLTKKKLCEPKTRITKSIVAGTVFTGIVASIIIQQTNLRLIIVMFSGIILIGFYFSIWVKLVEKEIMTTNMPMDEVTPGEWISKKTFVANKEQSPVKSIKQLVALFYDRTEKHTIAKRNKFINHKTKELIKKITINTYAGKKPIDSIIKKIKIKTNKETYNTFRKKIIYALHLEKENSFDTYIKKNNLEYLKEVLEKENIIFNKKYLCGPKDLGISEEQIKTVRREKIKSLLVKKGVPFIPAFLLGYVLVLFIQQHIGTTLLLLLQQII